MISLKELNPHNYPTTWEIDSNLKILCDRLNLIRSHYAVPMIVTSGLRTEAKQQQLIAAGVSRATKSHHLAGEAADIYDPDGKLSAFIKNNDRLLIEAELWCEDPGYTKGWVHFQIRPPLSGKRFFIP